jgi:hypothetical protein
MKIFLTRALNLLLYLSFCAMIGTGILMAFRLIPGSRGGEDWKYGMEPPRMGRSTYLDFLPIHCAGSAVSGPPLGVADQVRRQRTPFGA